MKQKMIYILMTLFVLALMSVGMVPKPKKDIAHYLGTSNELLDIDIQATVRQKGIQFIKDKDNEVIEIQLLDPHYRINGIAVGDSVSKIYEIYPSEWIAKQPNHIWVGMGASNHFGIITEELTFILGSTNLIQEIRLGYTTEFTKIDLPESNQEAVDLLQGRWLSTENRELVFDKGILGDNILDNIWEKQYYTITQPNEVLIKRVKEGQIERVKIKFWIDETSMYLFVIDDRGVPIGKSIERFIKKG